jgi:CTP:molybdopterin cytidylyltransferase MocA
VLVTENPPGPREWASIRASDDAATILHRLDAALLALCDQPAFSRKRRAAHRGNARPAAASLPHITRDERCARPFLREHFATLASLTGEEGARPAQR